MAQFREHAIAHKPLFVTLMPESAGKIGAKRQTPNAKRQTPNAKRQTPNAKRQTPNAL
jgi:hypothetical protein